MGGNIMRKIDIHANTRMTAGIPRMGSGTTYASPEQLIERYKELGIEKSVILPGVNLECGQHIQSNEEAIALVEKYPELFYWYCNIDPRMGKNRSDTDLSYFLNYYKRLGAKGVGEVCANMYFDDPFMENLFYHCEKCGMPLLFHIGPQIGGCYGIVDDIGLHRLEKELAKFPKLIFIGHSQPFWAEISSDVTAENRNRYPKGKVSEGRVVKLMRKYPNLYGDLSAGSGYNAVSRDPEFGYAFIEEFQDRLLFGTDICSPDDDRKLSFWLDKAAGDGMISQKAYARVCRENALRLLGV
jgi:predicted TIM-barrel fold metal-dependent hydrolase